MSCVKFGDSRSNRSLDIQAAHFVMDDNTSVRRSSHKAELLMAFLPNKRKKVLPQTLLGRKGLTGVVLIAFHDSGVRLSVADKKMAE